jgi:hypothetical protein
MLDIFSDIRFLQGVRNGPRKRKACYQEAKSWSWHNHIQNHIWPKPNKDMDHAVSHLWDEWEHTHHLLLVSFLIAEIKHLKLYLTYKQKNYAYTTLLLLFKH